MPVPRRGLPSLLAIAILTIYAFIALLSGSIGILTGGDGVSFAGFGGSRAASWVVLLMGAVGLAAAHAIGCQRTAGHLVGIVVLSTAVVLDLTSPSDGGRSVDLVTIVGLGGVVALAFDLRRLTSSPPLVRRGGH